MSHLNTSFDPDIDSFFNLDQADYTPLSASPNTKVPSLSHTSSSSSSNFANSSSQQTFSGPSFQYDAHRQQTGLPVGGLANTIALNQANGLQYYDTQSGFVMPTETLNMPLSKLEDFDFARNPSIDMSDMDFDADSPSDMPTMFYPNGGSSQSQFISPNTLVASNASPATSTPVQRIYPGMHSQQAAQAKAQQAQKQQEMLRQQQQPRQLPGQKSLPSQPKSQQTKDPLVEESISRLLSQMRQNSVASTADDESTPTNGSSNMPRIKKDEDDMDEDERLLASEEGKKLSSKERRQLRNKVSARAFRSRRKEYIGQLEGEVAMKVSEANDLRAENRQLREENTRLTDLTRMLLSSQAFSGFLQELSQSGGAVPNTLQSAQQTQPRSQPQPMRKDVNPHDAARQMQVQQPQIGMALMPETNVDTSLFETPAWNSGFTSNEYHVFAVTELPEAPVLDLENISGKPKHSVTSASRPSKDLPSLPQMPEIQQAEVAKPTVVDESVSLNEETFTLFFDKALPTMSSNPTPTRTLDLAAKQHFIPVVKPMAIKGGTWKSLELLCSSLEETSNRIAALMPEMT